MATYRYSAKTVDGELAVGSIDASHPDEALDLLLSHGLADIQIIVTVKSPKGTGEASPEPPLRPLTTDEATELTQQVAQLSSAKVPLAIGLRAAAERAARFASQRHLHWMPARRSVADRWKTF